MKLTRKRKSDHQAVAEAGTDENEICDGISENPATNNSSITVKQLKI